MEGYVQRRMNSLETQVRFLLFGVVGLLIAFVYLLVWRPMQSPAGAATRQPVQPAVESSEPDSTGTIDARRVIIRDEMGNVRAVLGCGDGLGQDGSGVASLSLMGSDGKTWAQLSCVENMGSSLVLFGSHGDDESLASGVRLAALGDDFAAAELRSTKSVATLSRDGLSVTQGGIVRATYGVAKLVKPKTGEATTTAPTVVLFDTEGLVRWQAP